MRLFEIVKRVDDIDVKSTHNAVFVLNTLIEHGKFRGVQLILNTPFTINRHYVSEDDFSNKYGKCVLRYAGMIRLNPFDDLIIAFNHAVKPI